MVGFLCFLVLMVPLPWLLMPLRVLPTFLRLPLVGILLGLLLNGLHLMILIMIWLFLLCLIILMSGQMAALFLINLLVFPLQVLGFLLIRLSISGDVAGGVMLMVFVLIQILRAVEVSVLFLGLFSLFRGLK